MLTQIFSVYDSKAEAYMQPFFFQGKGQAVRSFSDLVNDNSTLCGKHPQDFTLFHIGEFDDATGNVSSSVHTSLGTGQEFKTGELL